MSDKKLKNILSRITKVPTNLEDNVNQNANDDVSLETDRQVETSVSEIKRFELLIIELKLEMNEIKEKYEKSEHLNQEINKEIKSTKNIIGFIFAFITLFIGVLWHIIWVKSIFTWSDNKSFQYNASAYAFIISIPIIFVASMILIHWTIFKKIPKLIIKNSKTKN